MRQEKPYKVFNYDRRLRRWLCVECGVPQSRNKRLWGEAQYHRQRCRTRLAAAAEIRRAVETAKRFKQLTETPLTVVKPTYYKFKLHTEPDLDEPPKLYLPKDK